MDEKSTTVHEKIKKLRENGHKIHYVFFDERGLSSFELFYSQNFVDTLDVIKINGVQKKCSNGYYEFDSWYQDGLGENIAKLCNIYKIDAVICTYLMYSKLLDYVTDNILKIIDVPDKISDGHISLRKNSIPVEFFCCSKEDEAKYLNRADIVWGVRNEEIQYLNSIMGNNKAINVSHFDECFNTKTIHENINDNTNCSGCGICVDFCPHKAISINKNTNGFYSAERTDKCSLCGLCYKLCAIKNKYNKTKIDEYTSTDEVFGNYVSVYAAKSTNRNLQHNSSTAGFIRTFLIENLDKFDGVITLCETDNPLKPEVRILYSEYDILKNIAKSKYFSVEVSKMAEILKKTEGNYIVVGLPCQIATLNRARKYLKASFFAIELFCGAIYSQNLMEKYFILKDINAHRIDFRDKLSGWHNFSLTVSEKEKLQNNGSTTQKNVCTKANDDEFYFAQRNKFCTLDACLKCKYCYQGTGDIQVGDFWGDKFKNDDSGVNLIISRTQKAEELINHTPNLELQICTIEDVYNSQPWFVEADKRINNWEKNICQDDINSLSNKLKINKSMQDYVNNSIRISELRKIYEIRKKELSRKVDIVEDNSFVILPSDSSSLQSFGDQAMNAILLHSIYSKFQNSKVAYFSFHNNSDYIKFENDYNYKINILQPDKNNTKSLVERFREQANEYKTLIVIGADVLDGGCGIQQAVDYCNIMLDALYTGKKVIITGMSFNNYNNPEIVEKIINVSFAGAIINVRDEISYSRLKLLGCKNLVQVADMAFLFDETKYKTSEFANNLKMQLDEYKSQGKKIVALHLTSTQEKADDFVDKVIKSIKEYKDVVYVAFPQDYRIIPDYLLPDEDMCNKICEKMSELGFEVINAYKLQNEIDVKSVIGLCDLLITCRMHIAIAAFSKNVPVISFVYQGKFEGLYKFYDFEQNLMFEKDNFEVDKLSGAISYILNNDFSKMIEEKNKKVFELSQKNFEF